MANSLGHSLFTNVRKVSLSILCSMVRSKSIFLPLLYIFICRLKRYYKGLCSQFDDFTSLLLTYSNFSLPVYRQNNLPSFHQFGQLKVYLLANTNVESS